MRNRIDKFKNFILKENSKTSKFGPWRSGVDISKDRDELIDIFKWISDGKYDGKYPNFQLGGTPKNISLSFQRFFHEKEFEVEDWMIDGIKYIINVYKYEYSSKSIGAPWKNIKPILITFEIDNPNYDAIADLLHDEEGVIAGGKSPKNSNKKIMKSEKFDKIEDVLGLKVSNLCISISKVDG